MENTAEHAIALTAPVVVSTDQAMKEVREALSKLTKFDGVQPGTL